METEEIRILPDFVSGNFGVEDDKIGIGSIVASLLHQVANVIKLFTAVIYEFL